MQRDDSLLLDMLQAARQIREYTSGLQEPDFLHSRLDQDAVLLQCTVLGEWPSVFLSNSETPILRSLGGKSWASGML